MPGAAEVEPLEAHHRDGDGDEVRAPGIGVGGWPVAVGFGGIGEDAASDLLKPGGRAAIVLIALLAVAPLSLGGCGSSGSDDGGGGPGSVR